VLGGQPNGAVVLAGESGDLAVALAVRPTEHRLLLVVTVLGQDGSGDGSLKVSLTLHLEAGSPVTIEAKRGPLGTYGAEAALRARPTRVDVRLAGRGAGGNPVVFRLPAAWPPRAAAALVTSAARAFGQLGTLVTRERLAADRIHKVRSVYRAVAPSSLDIRSSNGTETIVIGKRRWDRVGTGPWESSTQSPPLRAIRPFWVGDVQDATLLGHAVVRGRRTWVVSFAAPQMPAFFTVWVDERTQRTLRLRMTASAHFMLHDYGPFDAPLRISAP
jgi:hypothetical protein